MIPTVVYRSPLAHPVPNVRDPKLGHPREDGPQGLLAHTTGRGVCDQAIREKRTPLAVALDIYVASQNGSNGYFWGGPTYVLDYSGHPWQLAPEDIRTEHAGHAHRDLYLSGAWVNKCSPATVQHWRQQWPGVKSPQHLFATRSPNNPYIGVEMLPLSAEVAKVYNLTPRAPGLLFTQAQHDGLIKLGIDIADRLDWDGFPARSSLVGHEDVNPIDRHDAGGGWDPGALRDRPYFDFAYVRRELAAYYTRVAPAKGT